MMAARKRGGRCRGQSLRVGTRIAIREGAARWGRYRLARLLAHVTIASYTVGRPRGRGQGTVPALSSSKGCRGQQKDFRLPPPPLISRLRSALLIGRDRLSPSCIKFRLLTRFGLA